MQNPNRVYLYNNKEYFLDQIHNDIKSELLEQAMEELQELQQTMKIERRGLYGQDFKILRDE